MGCLQSKTIVVHISQDHFHKCHRVRVESIQGSSRFTYPHGFILGLLAEDPIKSCTCLKPKASLRYGHLGHYTLFVYGLDPTKTFTFGRLLGARIARFSCRGIFSPRVHVTTKDVTV